MQAAAVLARPVCDARRTVLLRFQPVQSMIESVPAGAVPFSLQNKLRNGSSAPTRERNIS
jgi:hypothetical protein